jgi:hypothetical protein
MRIRHGPSISLVDSRPAEPYLALKGQSVPFVHRVTCLGVIFDRRTTSKISIDTTEATASSIFIRISYLFKSEDLSANVKFTLCM